MDKDKLYQELVAKHGVGNVKIIMLESGNCVFLLDMTKCKHLFNLYAKAMPLLKADDLVNVGRLMLNYLYIGGAFGDEKEFNGVDVNTMDYVNACILASQLFVFPGGNVQQAPTLTKSGAETPQ